jgi:hypothetical protein
LPDQIVAEVGGKRKTELLVLRCDQPIQGQRLHLLPVALNEAERPGLQERALKAIGAKRNGQGLFTAPGFEEVKVYGLNAATGVTLSALTEVLRYEIPQSIQLARRRPTARPLNDVVLIYYQGSEYVDPSGEFHLLTGQSLDFGPNPDGRPRFALPGSAVARAFARTPGAQVLVMDVSRTDARATPGRRHPRPANDRFGVMRSAWKTDDPPQRAALPADAPSVLGAMQSATATAGTLRELESRLRRVFGRLVLPGFLGFESDLPPELLDALSIGPPA